ncbi:hypothetical protein PIB30_046584 [Stylosanthes scabra]|uniref:CCT domain-containing protein n=1 Tax=Stylosanthes scabra TaxID=79078 RepID=A0ABU6YH01_9FABA|nr:hypothetical protein [Stylosanthes scabra]
MGYTSLLRSPKKEEEQQVPQVTYSSSSSTILPFSNNQQLPYHNDDEEFSILEELEGVLDIEEEEEEEQKMLPSPYQGMVNSCGSGDDEELHWDFMEWEEDHHQFPEAEELKVVVRDDDNRIISNNSKCLMEEEEKQKKMVIKMEEEEESNNNNVVGFWEVEDEKMVALNLNLNYQEVLDAWSDRGSLWADDYSLSLAATNNGYYYMGEVPVLEEERTRREASVLRYKEKRQNRLFSKKIRYQVRKLNADKRPRIKGRFVKRH